MFGNSPRRDLGFVTAYAQCLEALGFHALHVPEHVVFFADYESSYPYSTDGSANWGPDTGLFDPLFVIAAAASATTTLGFCTGVLILPQRPALLTAKEALTLDHFTGGRFELGVGVGWSWEEYGALGVPFDRRGRRMDEYIEAIRLAWTEDRASYHGEFVEFENAVLNPKPLTPGGPPIIIGGDSAPAMRRAASMGDGWYGWWAPQSHALAKTGSRTLEAHLDNLRTHVSNAGRSTDDGNFSLKLGVPLATETPDEIAAKIDEARALGVDEVVLAGPVGVSSMESTLELYAQAGGLQ